MIVTSIILSRGWSSINEGRISDGLLHAGMIRRRIRCFISAMLLVALLIATSGCAGDRNGGEMVMGSEIDVAWQAVVVSNDAAVQRAKLDAFLAANRQAGAGALMVYVRHRDSGETSAIDRALWENPERYVVTLRYGDRRYEFVPLSRASLEPLFHE